MLYAVAAGLIPSVNTNSFCLKISLSDTSASWKSSTLIARMKIGRSVTALCSVMHWNRRRRSVLIFMSASSSNLSESSSNPIL